jgi:hypothetical protein
MCCTVFRCGPAPFLRLSTDSGEWLADFGLRTRRWLFYIRFVSGLYVKRRSKP